MHTCAYACRYIPILTCYCVFGSGFHPHCVKLDSVPHGTWHCPYHTCSVCKRPADNQKYWCVQCTNSYCTKCLPPDLKNKSTALDLIEFLCQTCVDETAADQARGGKQSGRILFLKRVFAILRKMGRPLYRLPSVGGKPLELYTLYREVISAGGIGRVTTKSGGWAKIKQALKLPASVNQAGAILKKYYMALVYPYEKRFFTATLQPPLVEDPDNPWFVEEQQPPEEAGGARGSDDDSEDSSDDDEEEEAGDTNASDDEADIAFDVDSADHKHLMARIKQRDWLSEQTDTLRRQIERNHDAATRFFKTMQKAAIARRKRRLAADKNRRRKSGKSTKKKGSASGGGGKPGRKPKSDALALAIDDGDATMDGECCLSLLS